jgi:hypothetical protein
MWTHPKQTKLMGIKNSRASELTCRNRKMAYNYILPLYEST